MGRLCCKNSLRFYRFAASARVGRKSPPFSPLPTSRSLVATSVPIVSDEVMAWTLCIILSLNSFWGSDLFYDGTVSQAQRSCLNNIVKEATRFCSLSAVVPPSNWDDLFRVRSVDYKGDEVKVARRFAWRNVAPALPQEVGRVPLKDVCTLGSKHYVANFSQYLKPEDEWPELPRPKVMVDDADWGDVCHGLVITGVCKYLRASEVFHTRQGILLNGMFGVTKDEFTESGDEIFRLIMNLIPLNLMCSPMRGDVDTLPSWGSMNPFSCNRLRACW